MRHDDARPRAVDSDPVLSPREIAGRLGVSYPTVLEYLKNGELRGVKRGLFWFIRESAYNAFIDPDNATVA